MILKKSAKLLNFIVNSSAEDESMRASEITTCDDNEILSGEKG